jgi:hypothetical protein
MTEARIETWELGTGSEHELRLIREALRENPVVSDGRREGIALEGSFRLEGDRIIANVRIGGAPASPAGT